MADDPYVRPCDGSCGDASPHTHHLTEAGLAHYTDVPPPEAVPVPEDKVGDARTNMFFDAITARQVLGELAGYTSLCWEEDGTFQSERVTKAVDQALDRLEELGIITPSEKEKI